MVMLAFAPDAGARSREAPKSATLAIMPGCFSSTLPGFRSRCRTRCSWRYDMPRATSRAIDTNGYCHVGSGSTARSMSSESEKSISSVRMPLSISWHSSTKNCISRSDTWRFRSSLHATSVLAYCALYTSPVVPEPMKSCRVTRSHRISSKRFHSTSLIADRSYGEEADPAVPRMACSHDPRLGPADDGPLGRKPPTPLAMLAEELLAPGK
eukprot:scaffold159485_cov29-Tisochrysis_lutea.AAC.1